MHYLSIIGYMGWGTVIAAFGAAQLYNPIGICFELLSNSVIMANYTANNIVRWIIGSFSWILLAGSRSGTTGTSSTLLQRPIEVVLGSIGNFYAADRLNSRVPFFLIGQLNGTTIAGMPVGPRSYSHFSPLWYYVG